MHVCMPFCQSKTSYFDTNTSQIRICEEFLIHVLQVFYTITILQSVYNFSNNIPSHTTFSQAHFTLTNQNKNNSPRHYQIVVFSARVVTASYETHNNSTEAVPKTIGNGSVKCAYVGLSEHE